jgi:hypothetical protein
VENDTHSRDWPWIGCPIERCYDHRDIRGLRKKKTCLNTLTLALTLILTITLTGEKARQEKY